MKLPLEGLLVLDWSVWQQGPACSAMLADMGAEVIKIEQRGKGDPGRYFVGTGGKDTSQYPNWYFEANNRGKKSITLDLKKPEALEVVYALTEKSDIFVQNFRKGVAERLGLDYATLKKINPRLIYGSATGYGPEGPDSAEPSFDFLGQARSGIMNAVGEPDMPPLSITGGIADQMGAIMLAYGIMTAVVARERHGIGQAVDVSHLGSMAFLQGLSLTMKLMTGSAMRRYFRTQAGNPIWNHYRCADDRWIALAMLQSDRYWGDITRLLGRPELAEDPRFIDLRSRARNRVACIEILDEIFAMKPRDEWVKALREDQGDYIYSIVNDVDDLPDDPQIRANNYVVDVEHPEHGTIQMLGMPIGLSETPGAIRSLAPELGQHTEEVILEVLGWDWDRISALHEKEVI